MFGNINSIETMGLVDGPGIRVVVFMQGCPLRCLFCHNPEMWDINKKTEISSSDLVGKIMKYKNYFGQNGGVTFSGGEPLNQPEFLIEVLKICKENNIHTALDTSGVGKGNYDEILKYTDLVIFDIKAIDEFKYSYITGFSINSSLEFLSACQRLNKDMWLRQVIVPTINDTEEYINKLKEFIRPLKNIKKVELLPYHTIGVSKYSKLSIPYRLQGIPSMEKKEISKLYKLLTED